MENVNGARRIVVKIGTSTLTHESGRLNLRHINALIRVLSDIKNEGREVVVVSSGAIAAGVAKLKLPERPQEMRQKQAAAAVGQCELMHIYDSFFEEYGHTVAQVLLTKEDVDSKERRQHVVNTFESLLEYGTVPIVNENDTVSVDEIMQLTFGENDALSVVVAKICSADLLVILSDIDGLYDANPKENPGARLIPVVYELTDRIRCVASGAGSERGRGGMVTKLSAAEKAMAAGIPMIITNGAKPELLYNILNNEPVGTLFLPTPDLKQ